MSVFIIAEAGVNHNGSVELAKNLVDVAAKAKASAVKFQSFKADKLASSSAPKAEYQKRNDTKTSSQLEMLRALELSLEEQKEIFEYCQTRKITFLSSPFDVESLELLISHFDLSQIKIPSGEITNASLLLKAAQSQKPVILSTGMATFAEIEAALGILSFGFLRRSEKPSLKLFQESYLLPEAKALLTEKVTLLQCTTDYPAPHSETNLKVMDEFQKRFGLNAGFSDHTLGISASIAAVARGAKVIEKHFTLDRNLEGPDHRASLEPEELSLLVKSVREVEEALGVSEKKPTESEKKNIPIVRKSLAASCGIKKGEKFSEENLTTKRPASGVSAVYYWDYIGKESPRDYAEDEVIQS